MIGATELDMIERKIGYVDVGARGGTAARLAPFLDKLHRVLVEPDVAEAAKLQAESRNDTLYRVIPTALGHVDGVIDLYATVNPTCTSALKVNE
jgi:hypothetical protein